MNMVEFPAQFMFQMGLHIIVVLLFQFFVVSCMQIDQHQTVDGLLNALELGKYAIILKAEEVSAVYGDVYLINFLVLIY